MFQQEVDGLSCQIGDEFVLFGEVALGDYAGISLEFDSHASWDY